MLAVAVIGGIFLWNYFQSFESTDDAQVDGHVNLISSRVGGTVIGVYTENNRSVVKGQTLVTLDPNDYRVAVDQARANLEQAQAGLAAEDPTVGITRTSNVSAVASADAEVASAEAMVASAQRDYESALADLRQAEASDIQAEADEARYRALVQKDEVSREQYDQRLAAARAGRAVVDARRATGEANRRVVTQREAALVQARAKRLETRSNNPRQLTVRVANVRSQRANVDAAQAALSKSLLDLSYCKIGAPVAGIIGNKTVEVGQRVQAGEAMLAITPLDDMWVTANFKETQIERMRPGQRVTISVDALGTSFSGWVQNMAGATGARYSLLPPENATGNYVKVVQRLPVRIRFNSGQTGMERLRPGMSVVPKVWLR